MKSARELVAEANSRVETIEPAEAMVMLGNIEIVFVDLRDSAEIQREGKIPGAVHVNRGISCVHCHGQVNQLDEVRQLQPLSMSFCLDCHRDPGKNIRPPEQITNLDWQRPKDFDGNALVQHWNVHPPQSCSACHR